MKTRIDKLKFEKFIANATINDFENIRNIYKIKNCYLLEEDIIEAIRNIRINYLETRVDIALEALIPYLQDKISNEFIDEILATDNPLELDQESIFIRCFAFIENQLNYINEDNSHLYNFLDKMELRTLILKMYNKISKRTTGHTPYWLSYSPIYYPEFFDNNPHTIQKYRNYKFIFHDNDEGFIEHYQELFALNIHLKMDIENSGPGVKLYLQLQEN